MLILLMLLVKVAFWLPTMILAITVTRLVEARFSIKYQSVFQHNRKYAHDVELRGAEEIYTAIKNSIKDIYLPRKFILIIDGLDDILNNTEFKAEIITGLIRAVDEINRVFKKTTLSIKTIILIRDDILNLCRDPNLSKISRDSGIRLSWAIDGDPYDSDLIQLVCKRIDEVAGYKFIFKCLKEIFLKPSINLTLDMS